VLVLSREPLLFATVGEIMSFLRPNMTAGSSIVYNTTVQSKYFNWQAADGSAHQVWYDDPDTLRVKYSLAKRAGMRGLGIWGAGAPLHDPALAQLMWDAVPAPRKDPRWSLP
jgi:di-N-acetylchitobiase